MAGILRSKMEMPVMAVGVITEPQQAEDLIATSKADIVLLGRELMRNPHWAWTAAKALGVDSKPILAEQYGFFVG